MSQATHDRSTWLRSLSQDRVLAGLVATAVLASGWLLVGPVPVIASWIVQAGLDVTLAWTSWRVAQLGRDSRPVRRFWRGVAVGGVFFGLADSLQVMLVIEDRHGDGSNSIPQAILVVAGVASVVWVTLTHPLAVSDRQRLRLWLDAATVMAAVAAITWVLALPGGAFPDTPDRLLAAVGGAGIELVSAFGLIKLMLSGTAPFTRRSGIAGGMSAALSGLTIVAASLLAQIPNDGVELVIRLLPCVLLAATPRIQERQMRRDPGVLTGRRRRPYSRLPYVAVGFTQAMLVYLLVAEPVTARTWGAIVGVVASTGLVVLRQLIALDDNARLLARLDASMLEVQRQEERFRSLVQHASDITMVIDPDGRIGYGSPAFEQVLGWPAQRRDNVLALLHPDDNDAGRLLIKQLLNPPHQTVTAQLRARHADGNWRWLEVVGTNLLDNAAVGGLVLNARDITDARQFQDELHYQATHDQLTKLANRLLFHERIRLAALSRGSAGVPACIIAIDLDDFKIVNDTIGHHAGDALLVAVAERLDSCVRPTDTVARLGGDEFAIVLPDASREGARTVAERVLAAFIQPVPFEGHLLQIKASIGIAVGSTDDADALLRAADTAMYSAKHNGKGTYAFAG